MSNLTIFTFEEQQVRFVGTADKPEWIAQDVCNVLGIEEPSSVLRNFDPDEKRGASDAHTWRKAINAHCNGVWAIPFNLQIEQAHS